MKIIFKIAMIWFGVVYVIVCSGLCLSPIWVVIHGAESAKLLALLFTIPCCTLLNIGCVVLVKYAILVIENYD